MSIYRSSNLIFYVFHDRIDLTICRLKQLMSDLPSPRIIVCFGGPPSDFHSVVQKIKKQTDNYGVLSFFCSTTTENPWYNTDLLILEWFTAHGQNYEFDNLVYVEYDVLLLNPLDDLALCEDNEKYDLVVPWLSSDIDKPDWYWLTTDDYLIYKNWRKVRYHTSMQEKVLIAFAPIYFISYNILLKYSKMYLSNAHPKVFSEIRLPNVINLLGGTISEMPKSYVRWRPPYSLDNVQEITKQSSTEKKMIFHPVYFCPAVDR